jgi:hypothetical protein
MRTSEQLFPGIHDGQIPGIQSPVGMGGTPSRLLSALTDPEVSASIAAGLLRLIGVGIVAGIVNAGKLTGEQVSEAAVLRCQAAKSVATVAGGVHRECHYVLHGTYSSRRPKRVNGYSQEHVELDSRNLSTSVSRNLGSKKSNGESA